MAGLDIGGWLAESRDRLRERGLRQGGLKSLFYFYVGLWNSVSPRIQFGTNVYDRDWDMLVILDACRVDGLREVADGYDFVSDIKTMTSVGSTSDEWMAKTFSEPYRDEVARTGYVTGNVFTETLFDQDVYPPRNSTVPLSWPRWRRVEKSTFQAFEELWRYDEAWTSFENEEGEEIGYIPPRRLTDAAIGVDRELEPDRLIVHYMQPHWPYVRGVSGVDVDAPVDDPFAKLQAGTLSFEDAWALYLANIEVALDEVSVLLENVDRPRVAITADHGESFGGFGSYGHQVGLPHRSVKVVPWVETTASDEGTRDPTDLKRDTVDAETEELLGHLGYV